MDLERESLNGREREFLDEWEWESESLGSRGQESLDDLEPLGGLGNQGRLGGLEGLKNREFVALLGFVHPAGLKPGHLARGLADLVMGNSPENIQPKSTYLQ